MDSCQVLSIRTGSCVNSSRPDSIEQSSRSSSRYCSPVTTTTRSNYIALRLKQIEEERAIQRREWEMEKRFIEQQKEVIRERYRLLEMQYSERRKSNKHIRDVVSSTTTVVQVKHEDENHSLNRQGALHDSCIRGSILKNSRVGKQQLNSDGTQQRIIGAIPETLLDKQIGIAEGNVKSVVKSTITTHTLVSSSSSIYPKQIDTLQPSSGIYTVRLHNVAITNSPSPYENHLSFLMSQLVEQTHVSLTASISLGLLATKTHSVQTAKVNYSKKYVLSCTPPKLVAPSLPAPAPPPSTSSSKQIVLCGSLILVRDRTGYSASIQTSEKMKNVRVCERTAAKRYAKLLRSFIYKISIRMRGCDSLLKLISSINSKLQNLSRLVPDHWDHLWTAVMRKYWKLEIMHNTEEHMHVQKSTDAYSSTESVKRIWLDIKSKSSAAASAYILDRRTYIEGADTSNVSSDQQSHFYGYSMPVQILIKRKSQTLVDHEVCYLFMDTQIYRTREKRFTSNSMGKPFQNEPDRMKNHISRETKTRNGSQKGTRRRSDGNFLVKGPGYSLILEIKMLCRRLMTGHKCENVTYIVFRSKVAQHVKDRMDVGIYYIHWKGRQFYLWGRMITYRLVEYYDSNLSIKKQ
ncbi:uncharacterized protein LOC134228106 [Armigeres subalbatus]|uniref:uncharacterized protein LOC134228106 n=1 Tax=Armigeres subalbatus TaxID=124917 RepID=UPI002ED4641A